MVGTDPATINDLSGKGYTGVKHSHSHPNSTSDPRIPSGYFGYQKGNPASRTVHDRTFGDAGFANKTRTKSGFGKTKFEVYSPS